jgi:co-chaperonin GroES (HSP10)
MKAINGNVFIERLPQEKKHLGLHVSEKALTKNFLGVIRHIESDNFVTIGDVVHIPHYGVQDIEVDGTEYALTKASKLFAKRNGDSYQPINKYVKVRKCTNDHIRDKSGEIALYMTENHIEKTEWVEIIEVAGDCKTMCDRYLGMFCVAPENSERLARIGYTEDFCLHEDEIRFVTDGD